MELCQAKALGMLYHHYRGVRHVHANFDHGSRDQNLNLALLEEPHDLLFQVRLHPPVQNSDLEVRKNFLAQLAVHLHGGFQFGFLILFDYRINDISLMPGRNLLADELPHFVGAFVTDPAGDDRGTAGRHFVEHADVEVPVEGESQSARNGSGSHDEDVRFGTTNVRVGTDALARPVEQSSTILRRPSRICGASLRRTCGGTRPHVVCDRISLLHQLKSLHHAEPVLFVHDYQAQLRELDSLLDQGMGSDDQLRIPLCDMPAYLALAVVFK